MGHSLSLPSLLRRHPVLSPHDPWLFWPDPDDFAHWRWLSWGDVGNEVIRLLDHVPDPPGTVAFAYRPEPRRLLFDLAIQSVGGVAAPGDPATTSPPSAPGTLGSAAWIDIEDAMEDPRDPRISLQWRCPDPPPWPERWRQTEQQPFPGPVRVRHEGHWRSVSGPEQARRVERLQAQLPLAGQRRQIWVSYGALADLGERVILAWALRSGAAVLLEPLRERLVHTVLWARPTLLHGPSPVLDELRRGLARVTGGKTRPRALRRALGRLRLFLLTDRSALAGRTADFWKGLGVEVRRLDLDEVQGHSEAPAGLL